MRAFDRRADKDPAECEAKANRAGKAFGAPGSRAVLDALKALTTVRGVTLRTFGKFNESISILIEGMTHEGALKHLWEFGQGNYMAAFGQIRRWLKRRWPRLVVITAVESRYAAFEYNGRISQQQAAALNSWAQAQDDWREDGAFSQREEETAAPYFGGFGGAYKVDSNLAMVELQTIINRQNRV
jgi:hypothetical protein